MITTLQSLQNKFIYDPIFAQQFYTDTGVEIPNLSDADDASTEESIARRRTAVEAYGSNLLTAYYRALQNLLQDQNSDGFRRYPLYVRVPFNEDVFVIDTNTRIINIPKHFAQNGVGVVGDHLAEFLWFEVSRFYDMTDLMNCDIDITWHNTNIANMQQAYDSVPFAKYCDNEKVYFGWYITKNASLVAGQIEFAIRFFRNAIAEDSSSYNQFSLYIQPAKLTIKPGMTLTADTILDDDYDTIVRTRPIYSEIINSLDAAEPILDPTIIRGDYDLQGEDTISFTIGAISPDNAGLKLDPEALGPGETLDQLKAEIEFKWYWNNTLITEDGDSIKRIAPDLIDEAFLEIETEENNGVFTSTLTTNIPGSYRAYVGNKIIDRNNTNYNGVRYVQTNTAVLSEATQIKLLNTPSLVPVYYIEDVNTDMKFAIDYSEDSVNGEAKYRWIKYTDPNTEPATIPDWIPTGSTMSVISKTPGPGDRGWYKAEACNIKNNMITTVTAPVIGTTNNLVRVLERPITIATNDIIITPDENTNHRVTVSINNGYLDNHYEYRLRIVDTNTLTATQILEGYVVQGGTTRFDIDTLLSNLNITMAPGNYDLVVYVREITDYQGAYEQKSAEAHKGMHDLIFTE